MEQDITQKVLNNPKFQKMARTKRIYCWSFSILMFVIYVVYISYIGIDPAAFGVPVAEGKTTTVGIYIGLFVILFAIAITGIYVRQANGPLELITQEVIQEVMKDSGNGKQANGSEVVDNHTAKGA